MVIYTGDISVVQVALAQSPPHPFTALYGEDYWADYCLTLFKRKKKMNNVLKKWDIIRIIRLIGGVSIAVYAVISKDYIFLLLAGLFLIQAILNISCCGSSGCSTNNEKKQVYKEIIKPYKPQNKR